MLTLPCNECASLLIVEDSTRLYTPGVRCQSCGTTWQLQRVPTAPIALGSRNDLRGANITMGDVAGGSIIKRA